MAQPRTDSSGRIQKRDNTPAVVQPTLADMLANPKFKEQLATAMPGGGLSADRMVRLVLTACRINPDLAQCTTLSLITCVFELAQLGLEPNTALGEGYLIPRRNKGTMECTKIVGYKGLIALAHRAGVTVTAEPVYSCDNFERTLGLHPDLIHIPSTVDGREDYRKYPITHAYAVGRGRDMEPVWRVVSAYEIEQRRARSSAKTDGPYSPWVKDYVPMCCKSAVRALDAYLPKATEMRRALQQEDAAERGQVNATLFDPEFAKLMSSAGVRDSDVVDSIDAAIEESEEADAKALTDGEQVGSATATDERQQELLTATQGGPNGRSS